MAVGDSGRHVQTTALVKPNPFAARVGAHIHKGAPETSQGGPGATVANGANQEGTDGSAPYARGGDED